MKVIQADLSNSDHCSAILGLTNMYAMDPMGGGKPLKPYVVENLISELKAFDNALIFLAYDGEMAVGVANCFVGFSTFYAKKLINIHDLAVSSEVRGRGVGMSLIEKVKEKAKEMDCCKVTLEVLENNEARRLYERAGFEYGDDDRYLFMSYYL